MGASHSIANTVTIGWLEQLYIQTGLNAVGDAVRVFAPTDLLADYAILPKEKGVSVYRPDIHEKDRIQYVNFSAPALWGMPVSILRIVLEPYEEKEELVFHSGEEVAIPIRGAFRYCFFWSDGGEPLSQKIEDFHPGEVGTICPSVPHHGWSADKNTAEAWIVLYHDPDSSAAFDIATNLRSEKVNRLQSERRRFNIKELQAGSGKYALTAWQIADRIKTQRQRVNLSIHQLAEQLGLDPSHLSRIESAGTNVSLEVLIKICSFLRIDLRSLLLSPKWCFERRELGALKGATCSWADATQKHLLHPCYHDVAKGAQLLANSCDRSEAQYSSWIVLGGDATVRIEDNESAKSFDLREGDVMHFRKNFRLLFEAITTIRMVAFHIASSCPQDTGGMAKTDSRFNLGPA